MELVLGGIGPEIVRLVRLPHDLDVLGSVLFRGEAEQVRERVRVQRALREEDLLLLGGVVARLEAVLEEPRWDPAKGVEPVSGVSEVVQDGDDVVHVKDGGNAETKDYNSDASSATEIVIMSGRAI